MTLDGREGGQRYYTRFGPSDDEVMRSRMEAFGGGAGEAPSEAPEEAENCLKTTKTDGEWGPEKTPGGQENPGPDSERAKRFELSTLSLGSGAQHEQSSGPRRAVWQEVRHEAPRHGPQAG